MTARKKAAASKRKRPTFEGKHSEGKHSELDVVLSDLRKAMGR